MKTRTSNTIEAGDMVHHHERLWLVETMRAGRPCSAQCAMYDADADKCCGYCYRWANGDDKVFRYLLPDTAVKEATEVVETPDLLAARITAGGDAGCEEVGRLHHLGGFLDGGVGQEVAEDLVVAVRPAVAIAAALVRVGVVHGALRGAGPARPHGLHEPQPLVVMYHVASLNRVGCPCLHISILICCFSAIHFFKDFFDFHHS